MASNSNRINCNPQEPQPVTSKFTMKKYLFTFILPLCLTSAFADGVASGTTPNWPDKTNRAEACAAAKDNARVNVSSSTNYYGKITGFGQCQCSSDSNNDGKTIYVCTVDAAYVRK